MITNVILFFYDLYQKGGSINILEVVKTLYRGSILSRSVTKGLGDQGNHTLEKYSFW